MRALIDQAKHTVIIGKSAQARSSFCTFIRRMRVYNTNNAVDDLDSIRAALGYERIVLDGGSYGTFFSLVYIRRHPDHVESAML